jgi:hypothetical protein
MRALGRRQVEDFEIVPARLDLPARALKGVIIAMAIALDNFLYRWSESG